MFFPANIGEVQSAGFSSVILPSWYAQSDQGGSEFGFAVAGAGDVNGDGYDDILIGAPKYDDGSVRGGAAFVFHGGPAGFGDTPHWSFGGEVKGSRLGAAVAGVGDINSDGYDDIIVGAYRYKDGQSEEGRAEAARDRQRRAAEHDQGA